MEYPERKRSMLLYHGTKYISARNIVESGIDFSKCDRLTDNARGFYLSRKMEFAADRAHFMAMPGERAAVVEMQYDEENANKELRVLNFDNVSEDWQFFVAFNRTGLEHFAIMNSFFPEKLHNLNSMYDVVIDIPADARISAKTYEIEKILETASKRENIAEKYKGDVLRLIRSISTGNIDPQARQYSFHTQRSLTYLKNARIIETGFAYNEEER